MRDAVLNDPHIRRPVEHVMTFSPCILWKRRVEAEEENDVAVFSAESRFRSLHLLQLPKRSNDRNRLFSMMLTTARGL